MPSTYVYQLNFSLYLLLIDMSIDMSYLSIKTTSSIENMSNKNNIKSRNFKFFSRQMFGN